MTGIAWNAGSGGSGGGTELAARQLERRMPADLLAKFQIYPSHYIPELADPGKIQVLWCHHSHEAGMLAYLGSGGWQRFAKIVFVSYWQARNLIARYDIPGWQCVVIPNAVGLVPAGGANRGPVPASTPVRLVYTSAPDRGLEILAHVFDEVCKYENVELDVFSAFGLYGEAWAAADSRFEHVFARLRSNPRVRCHGAAPNSEVLSSLSRAHVFAYPATVREVSCMSLMEAMSGALACVHPDFGALGETAAGWTCMYEHAADPQLHAERFCGELMAVVNALRNGDWILLSRLAAQKAFAEQRYCWDNRARQWEMVLRSLAEEDAGDR